MSQNQVFEPPAFADMQGAPLSQYYNLNGLSDVFLTCDTDWAPEFAIEYVLREVSRLGLKLTVFATGPSLVLQPAPDWLEIGLHPDFTRRNGPWIAERFTALKEHYPQAAGMRSHRNFFGQNVAEAALAAGLSYDVSTLLFNQSLVQAWVDQYGLTRFAYMWEDGIHLDMGSDLNLEKIRLDVPGLKILNEHPVLIYLNSISDDHRRAVTRGYTDLTMAPRAHLDSARNRERGIGSLWLELLQLIAENGVRTHLLGDVI